MASLHSVEEIDEYSFLHRPIYRNITLSLDRLSAMIGAMTPATSLEASRLIRRLREQAGLTQAELARRVGTTQSVVSRLESDEYEGHSLSMLYRVGVALNRRIVVTAVGEDSAGLWVGEGAPHYGPEPSGPRASEARLSDRVFNRLIERLAQRFSEQGVTKSDIEEAIRWAQGPAGGRSVEDLRGALEVGPGQVVDDVRRARARRGHHATRP